MKPNDTRKYIERMSPTYAPFVWLGESTGSTMALIGSADLMSINMTEFSLSSAALATPTAQWQRAGDTRF
ncbi:hypothetical protein MB84_20685 [Pandoraea oxalativorans]|uniref:Uncharacterized protein n=1 Tax=Pandoraea oxalativorans TaxID=573737 RepID=A0A0E3YFW8_9BURK|nr:hypothetical protein MB84_20685 [Pandoraea oxalativorans]